MDADVRFAVINRIPFLCMFLELSSMINILIKTHPPEDCFIAKYKLSEGLNHADALLAKLGHCLVQDIMVVWVVLEPKQDRIDGAERTGTSTAR